MFQLYLHQEQVIGELRQGLMDGHKRQVLALATGGGKTVVAAHLSRSAVEKGKRVLFIVDRIELVGQAVATFHALGLQVGVLQGDNTNYSREDDIIVASIQTIRSRAAPDWVHVVIIDECHILHQAHIKLMETWNALPFVGLSATPLRKGLGKYFTNLVRGPSVRWLTDHGFLVPCRGFAPAADAVAEALKGVKKGTTTNGYDYLEADLAAAVNSKELVGDIVTTWQERGENRPTLCFAVNIAHSKAIRDDFEAVGVTVGHIDAYTEAPERKRLIQGFRDGDIRILTSVNVLGIGFDVPDAACLILARPTLSEALHMQQMGRGIRTAEGKRDCLVLDHSGNTLKHGLPVHFEVPDLDDGEKGKAEKRKKKDQEEFILCSHCGAVMERTEMTCQECGLDRPDRRPKVSYRDGDLVEFGAADEDIATGDDARMLFYRRCLGVLVAQGKKPGAAYFLTREKFKGFEPPKHWRGLLPDNPTPEVARWIKSRNIRWAKGQGKAK
ncbi:DEAD/DEAH box helicase [Thiocystis violascens]|uniref:DNA/RNA helicase, superfamily II n=1 Tax=Thiocystis violascens (strain ATCC 17096 / DSM 198 / 6111) TaxID=765911 RepID=I3YHD4_THIV6|nr:DEAD/DEAH box helicase [Thiocystis violascens]AFL76402.1 DNA/RNA helicase, superfamily II [Thiocystis violascens DSM 198]